MAMHRVGFDEFVTHRSPRLLRTAYLLTGDRAAAEDLLQSTLVKTWRAWNRLEGDPEPYVRRVLVTTATSAWRRRWRAELPHGELPEPARFAVPDPEPGSGRRLDLWSALRRLPARQRAAVVLRFFDDLTEAQTAELLGCSIGTVKSQTRKALARLRVDAGLVGYAPASPEVAS